MVRSPDEKTIKAELYKQIYHSMTHPAMVLDPDRNIVSANPAARKLSGFLMSELLQKKCHDIFSNPDTGGEQAFCPFADIFNGKIRETMSAEIETEKGHFLISCTPIYNRNNVLERIIHISTDISEIKKIETETAMLLEATRSIPLSRDFNESARKIYDICKNHIGATCGYVALMSGDEKENDLLFLDDGGLPCYVDPNLPMPIRGLREQAYVSGKVVYSNNFMKSDHVRHMPDGHMKLTNVMFSPLIFGDRAAGVIGLANKPGGFLEQDAQIAESFGEIAALALEHSRIREVLIEREKFSSNLLKESPNPILVINPDKSIRYVNQSFEKLTGYTSEEVVGQTPPYPWWPKDTLKKTQAEFNQALKTGAIKAEKEFEKKTGDIFYVQITSTPVPDTDSGYYLASWVDITDRKNKEKQLEHHARKLEDMNTALNVLIDYRIEEKNRFKQELLKNFETLVFPYFPHTIETKTREELAIIISILEQNIKEILLKGDNKKRSLYTGLTRMESQIALLIKEEKTSKEMAKILKISERAVYFHRENIRKKLNLSGTKVNLKTFLQSEPF